MLFGKFKILKDHGVQYIPDLDAVELPAVFRGKPELTEHGLDSVKIQETVRLCPTGALDAGPLAIDMGRCIFCGECAFRHPANIVFTNNFRMAAQYREDLVVKADDDGSFPRWNPRKLFRGALKLRQVSAGGDASCEMELNAAGNVNFDLSRYGIEFQASPRHCDGIVITGPVTVNMARETEAALAAVPQPRMIIAIGTDAISGGLFAGAPAVDRSFFERHTPDLYVPGNPAHPLSFIDGILRLTGRKN